MFAHSNIFRFFSYWIVSRSNHGNFCFRAFKKKISKECRLDWSTIRFRLLIDDFKRLDQIVCPCMWYSVMRFRVVFVLWKINFENLNLFCRQIDLFGVWMICLKYLSLCIRFFIKFKYVMGNIEYQRILLYIPNNSISKLLVQYCLQT